MIFCGKSKLVQLKLNIRVSGGEYTPPEVETGERPLIEVGVSPLDEVVGRVIYLTGVDEKL